MKPDFEYFFNKTITKDEAISKLDREQVVGAILKKMEIKPSYRIGLDDEILIVHLGAGKLASVTFEDALYFLAKGDKK